MGHSGFSPAPRPPNWSQSEYSCAFTLTMLGLYGRPPPRRLPDPHSKPCTPDGVDRREEDEGGTTSSRMPSSGTPDHTNIPRKTSTHAEGPLGRGSSLIGKQCPSTPTSGLRSVTARGYAASPSHLYDPFLNTYCFILSPEDHPQSDLRGQQGTLN